MGLKSEARLYVSGENEGDKERREAIFHNLNMKYWLDSPKGTGLVDAYTGNTVESEPYFSHFGLRPIVRVEPNLISM